MESNTEKTAGSNLTPIAEYTETAAALADLRQRHAGVVYDVTVPKQMKLAKEARAELRAMRAQVEESLAWLDTLSTVTRSGQVNPPPADTAARGELIEDLA